MEYFDIINALFSNKKWEEVIENDKKKFGFQVLRLVSIKYPYEAYQFNGLKLNIVEVVNHFQRILSRNFKSVPKWIFTKSIKTKEKKESKLSKFDSKIILEYKEINKISEPEYENIVEFFEEDLLKELKIIENIHKK